MPCHFINRGIQTYFLLILTLNSFTAIYSQESQPNRELEEAIDNVKNANYELAIHVLKRYAEMKGLDDFNALEINIYLNLSYLVTKNKALDVKKVNALTDSYFAKHGIAKTDRLKSQDEIQLLLYASRINSNVKNNEKMVYYLSQIKNYYEVNHFEQDQVYSITLNQLSQGYYDLSDYKTAIEIGLKAWKVNLDLFGEKNNISFEILEILYQSYTKNNEPGKFLDFLNTEGLVSNTYFKEKCLDYLIAFNNLGTEYSNLNHYREALEINLKVVELRKVVLGEKNSAYLISLNNLGETYSGLGNYQKALEIHLNALQIKRDVLGEKNSSYLTSLYNVACTYLDLKDYQEALVMFLNVVELRKEVLGEKNISYIKSLSRLSTVYSYLEDYQKALEICLKVVELKKEVLGEKNTSYIKSLSELSYIYSKLGNFHKVLEIDLMISELRLQVLGETHSDYLKSLNDLVGDYSNLGYNDKSLKLCLKVVELKKEVLGEKHPDYLSSLSNLAVIYLNLGYYKKSLEINIKVVELRKEVLGEKHHDYITSLNNLAWGYSILGDFLKAIEINLRAVELGKEVLGEKDKIYLASVGNLASIYSLLGDYSKALVISLNLGESIKINLGETNPLYSTWLGNLGSIYNSLGDLDKALEITLNTVELRKKILGEKHIDYLFSLDNLATAYLNLDDYSKALEISLNSIEIIKEVLGEEHPFYLISMNTLATEYLNLGDYQKAIEINFKVVEIGKKVWGEQNPDYLSSLCNLAITEIYLSKHDSAVCHYLEMLNKTQERVSDYFSLMTEHQRELFWKKHSRYFTLFPVFYEKTALIHPEGANDAYNFSLFSKGLLLNTDLDFENLIAEKGTTEAIAKFEELKLLRLEIQLLLEKPISERYLNVDSLENIAQQKETELVKTSKEYGDYTSNLKVTWEDVKANLQEKDVAIEFVEYPTLTDTVKYAALVLRKGWQYPKFIPLFRKDEIEGFIKQDKNKIYANGIVGKQIKNLIWTPLETVVSPADRVYFSPAGIIHQLAIENLPLDDSTTIGDRCQMYRLYLQKNWLFPILRILPVQLSYMEV